MTTNRTICHAENPSNPPKWRDVTNSPSQGKSFRQSNRTHRYLIHAFPSHQRAITVLLLDRVSTHPILLHLWPSLSQVF